MFQNLHAAVYVWNGLFLAEFHEQLCVDVQWAQSPLHELYSVHVHVSYCIHACTLYYQGRGYYLA